VSQDDTFKPTIQDAQVLAGGMRLAEIDDQGRLVFIDRYQRRCVARGTTIVAVDLCDLMTAILSYYQERSVSW
jgi:hypothetical protein